MILDLDITSIPQTSVLAAALGLGAKYDLPATTWKNILWEHAKEGRAVIEKEGREVLGIAIYALTDDPIKADSETYDIKGSGTVIWCPFAASKKPGILRKMVSHVMKKHPTARELAYRRSKTETMVRRRLCHGR